MKKKNLENWIIKTDFKFNFKIKKSIRIMKVKKM